jgi:two-component sensor histidine kinase
VVAQQGFSLFILWAMAFLVLVIRETLALVELRTVALARDIAAREQAERALRQALADKELLLRELHHRTKNNLQMLASLLELQADTVASPAGKAALEESAARIGAMGRVHEQLYASIASGRVPLGGYLRRLAEGFCEIAHAHGVAVTLDLPVAGPHLDVDRALLCGLIVNELLTNAMKHAFPAGMAGEAGIAMHRGGNRIRLRVWDTGRGLPAGLNLEATNSLGLRLVQILARRLRADLAMTTSPGTEFTLTFPPVPEE